MKETGFKHKFKILPSWESRPRVYSCQPQTPSRSRDACNDGQSQTPQKAASQLPKPTLPYPRGSRGQHFAFERFRCRRSPPLPLASRLRRQHLAGVILRRGQRVFPMAASSPGHGERARLTPGILWSLYPTLFRASAVVTC